MKVYRDCLNGVPPFDSPAFMTIFDASANVVMILQVPITSSITVPPTNNSPCAPASAGNACVEEAIYETTVNLPPMAGGYYVVYQRCCRNGTILNLVNPGQVGATYWEHIPGPEVVSVNSSPRFSFRPPIYICNMNPIAFNHVATDPDGDSLVYKMCDPFEGLDASCPVVDGTGTPGSCPYNNTPPPYNGVPFLAPYTGSYPMATSPAINVNSTTGFLNGNPTTQGQWVVGVCVEEWRAGVLIGVHHRDFQFNVISCPFVVSADIISQTGTNNGQGTGFCNGFTISYSNNSFNGTTYHWDFGDPSTLADTSNLYNPTYTFPNIGIYTVTLYVNPGSPCGDTTTEVFEVHPLLSPSLIQPSNQCLNGNTYNFTGGGQFQGNGTFNWDFGNGANPQSATTVNVPNVTYTATGVQTVSFTVSENGCTATATKTLEIYPNPIANIGNYTTSGCVPLAVTFQNLSTGNSSISYQWNFSDGSSSTDVSPTITFTLPGIYSVSLTATQSQGCIDTSEVTAVNTITVANIPTSQFNYTSATAECFNNNDLDFTNSSTASASATYTWSFGANANPQNSNSFNVSNVNYAMPGVYTVTLTVGEAECIHTSTQTVTLIQNPVPVIGVFPSSGCSPVTINFSNQSLGNPTSYTWNFGDGTSSSTPNPVKTYTAEGVYSISLAVSSTTGCIETNSITAANSITITQTPDAAFSSISATGLCFDNNKFSFNNTSVFTGSVTHLWDFGSNAIPPTSSLLNPGFVNYSAPGIYTVTLTENKNGCIDTAKKVLEIYPNPVANLGSYETSGCDPLTINFSNQSTSASPLSYTWMFSDGTTSNEANPSHVFSPPGIYSFMLAIATNDKCIGTSTVVSIVSVTVNPKPTAYFTYITDNSSFVSCTDASTSDVVSWHYNFGDGPSSADPNSIHYYNTVDIYNITETVTNNFGCTDTHTEQVTIIPEFGFWIPNSFTPGNNDALNDIFKPVIFGAEDYSFMVFNRWGEMIYETHDLEAGWDGTFKGAESPMDVYVWKCDFKNSTNNKREYHVGHVTLVR